ncbi:MAG: protein kinase domain-containing protein [Phyllobacterium sp.]
MRPDEPPASLQRIATQFSALWRALSHDGDTPRAPDDIRLLADRVRDALDRRQDRLENADVAFIANSFLLEAIVHDGTPMQVHRIRHRDLGSLHALKAPRPDQADNALARDLLLREAQLATALDHRNVLGVQIALRLPDGRPALIMEWMPFTLSDRLNREAFSLEDIQGAMTSLLSGLEANHMAGLVHADIAPDNLLLKDHRLTGLKVADFGVALERGQSHADLALAKAGHTQFSAPEQVEGHALDNRADLYSCGRILELLIARCPAAGNVFRQLSLLARDLTEHEPDNRPEDAAAVLKRLKGIGQG